MNIKSLFALFILLIITSCSKSDDAGGSQSSISPPSWIQGTWLSGSAGFRFEQDDLYVITNLFEQGQKQNIENAENLGIDVVVEEDETENIYNLRIDFKTQGIITKYEFSKKSDDVIVWENHSALKPEYTRQ